MPASQNNPLREKTLIPSLHPAQGEEREELKQHGESWGRWDAAF